LLLVVLTVFSNGHHVLDMVVNSAAPELTMTVLVAVFILLFGVGSDHPHRGRMKYLASAAPIRPFPGSRASLIPSLRGRSLDVH
jgi:hypothetical protein